MSPQRPSFLLYYLLAPFILLYVLIAYTYRRNRLCVERGSLVLFNHASNLDFLFTGASVWPRRINFVVAYYWFLNKPLAWLLRTMGSISKYQFASDVPAIRAIKQVVERGGVVAIAPEGTVSSTGTNGYISPAIGKLIRFLGVPVYAVVNSGAYMTAPKWAKYSRLGHVESKKQLLFTSEQARELSVEKLTEGVREALYYDDYAFAKDRRRYRCRALAENITNILYLCPVCKSEHTLRAKGHRVSCSKCGMSVTIAPNGALAFDQKQVYNNCREWLDHQNAAAYETVRKPFSFSEPCEYLTDAPDGSYIKIGEGVMTFTNDGFTYVGTKRGEAVSEFAPLTSFPTLTVDSGKNFELAYSDGVRCFSPENKSSIQKWCLLHRAAFDLSTEEQKCNRSSEKK